MPILPMNIGRDVLPEKLWNTPWLTITSAWHSMTTCRRKRKKKVTERRNIMEEVRYWIATDGEKFDDKEACRIYEEGLRFGELEGTFLCMTLTRKD